MAINKFQRSRLTFQAMPVILESHQYIKTLLVFSETTGPMELKFHMETPSVERNKIYNNSKLSHDQDGRHADMR